MSTLRRTNDRVALAQAIKAGEVTDHGHQQGLITWKQGPATSVPVTGRVAEFRKAGLLEGPSADGVRPPYPVRLNAAGEAWLVEHSSVCFGCSDDALGPKWGEESLRRPHTCDKSEVSG